MGDDEDTKWVALVDGRKWWRARLCSQNGYDLYGQCYCSHAQTLRLEGVKEHFGEYYALSSEKFVAEL